MIKPEELDELLAEEKHSALRYRELGLSTIAKDEMRHFAILFRMRKKYFKK